MNLGSLILVRKEKIESAAFDFIKATDGLVQVIGMAQRDFRERKAPASEGSPGVWTETLPAPRAVSKLPVAVKFLSEHAGEDQGCRWYPAPPGRLRLPNFGGSPS